MALSTAQLNARQALLRRGVWPLLKQGKSLGIILTRLVENLEQQAESMLAAVFLYHPARNDLTIGAAPHLQPIYKKAVNGFQCGPHQPACGSAVFKRQRVVCVDVKTDPLWENLRDLAETIGIRAVWSQPVFAVNGNVLGTVAFYLPQPKAPDSADILVLEAAANIVAEIIQARVDETNLLISAPVDVKEPRHQCIIYKGPPSDQLSMFASLVRQKLGEGWRCLYLNRPPMVAGLRSRLAATGVDVSTEVAKGRLILSSDSPTSHDGDFDSYQMISQLEDLVNQAVADGLKGLWASGDMTWEFGPERNLAKLLEYEHELEKLFHRNAHLTGICQYHADSLPSDALRHGLLSHQSIFISQTLSRTNPLYLPTGRLEDCQATDENLDEAIEAYTAATDVKRGAVGADCSPTDFASLDLQ